MFVCGQYFTQSIIDQIKETIFEEPCISQSELSRRVCQWLNWRAPNGRLQEMSCRKALLELEDQGYLSLPRHSGPHGFEKSRPVPLPDISQVECDLDQLGEISIVPINSRYSKDSKNWFALMKHYHYLGGGPLCGAQIRYIVKSSEYGYLGALAFSSATRRLKDRDDYIGWSETARMHNLNQVIGNARFLILPTVKVPNLASYVLALTLQRLPGDWEEKYNTSPVLVETFVDASRFSGACYKATNWECVGQTSGCRDGQPKQIFVHSLCADWRAQLCLEPRIRLGDMPRPESPSSWAEEEFGSARIFDNRLKQRLYKIAEDFYSAPESNIPEASGSKANAVGAYRFFQNSRVSMDILLDAHTEATVDRIRQHSIVLCPGGIRPSLLWRHR